jgi:hypothetical protein
MWTCFNTYAATGAKLCLEVKDDGFSILDLVDLFVGNWIYGMQLQCVDWACHHTIVTAGTMLHVNMHCKCHFLIHAPARSIIKIDIKKVVK